MIKVAKSFCFSLRKYDVVYVRRKTLSVCLNTVGIMDVC